jgi:AraC-like DNA-binding protein
MKTVTTFLSIIFLILSNTTLSLAQQNKEALVILDSLKKTNNEQLLSKIKEITPNEQLYIISTKTSSSIGVLLLAIFTFLAIVFYFFKRQKRNRYNIEKLLLTQESKEVSKEEMMRDRKRVSITTSNLDILQHIIDDIQKKLKRFEKDLGFLSKECNLNKVANDFETNARYLSKIINAEKGVSFPVYINELRINYAVTELKVNKKFRSYNIKAIAETVGFNTAETFSKAFFIKTGIQPSYFIKELKNK